MVEKKCIKVSLLHKCDFTLIAKKKKKKKKKNTTKLTSAKLKKKKIIPIMLYLIEGSRKRANSIDPEGATHYEQTF